MPDDNLDPAAAEERLGDAETSDEAAILHYCEALRLMMPAVAASAQSGPEQSESFGRITGAYQRLHDKVDSRRAVPAPPPMVVVPSPPPPPAPEPSDLTVYKFQPGMIIRVKQTFRDYDDQEIQAGELLHLLETSYFPYESGHTLKFAEKTIRLSGDVDEESAIITNQGNAWFELAAE